MTTRQRVTAVLATEDHAEAIAAFYREVWDPAATANSVVASMRRAAADNLAAPGEYPPTALVLEGSRVIGCCGSIPQRLWNGSKELPAYWVKGLMVLPEFRNGPVGFLAVKELTRFLPRATILTVAPAARRLFAALGYADCGAVTNWVKPLRPGTVLRKVDLTKIGFGALPAWASAGVRAAQRSGLAGIAASVAWFGVEVVANATRLARRRFDWSLERPSRAELDELWSMSRSGLAASPVRDGAYLIPRFIELTEHPDANQYMFPTIRENSRVVGGAAVRRPRATSDPRLTGLRIATISDIVFPPDRRDAGFATLGASERCARTMEADAVTCMSSHPSLTRLLKRQGYLRLAGNVHFFVRDVTEASPWPIDLSAWWLARGDGESDATF